MISPGLSARISLSPILLRAAAIACSLVIALLASKHIANNFAQILSKQRQWSQWETIKLQALSTSVQLLANRINLWELPSEGKGHTFESCRVRHCLNLMYQLLISLIVGSQKLLRTAGHTLVTTEELFQWQRYAFAMTSGRFKSAASAIKPVLNPS